MARPRFQRGCLFKRGKKRKVWVARWRDPILRDGELQYIHRSKVVGPETELKTRKQAQRALDRFLGSINDPSYRPTENLTFEAFVRRWESTVLPQKKPSYQVALRSILRSDLLPRFGGQSIQDITTEDIQRFVSSLQVKPRTVRNKYNALRSILRSARRWGYLDRNPADGVELPRMVGEPGKVFSIDEVRLILRAAAEPERSLYWVAAETGLRAGELLGLQVKDLDLDRPVLFVTQSAWRGRLQSPKSRHAYRSCDLSPQLAQHLREYLNRDWQPNVLGLLFPSRRGGVQAQSNFLKRKLYRLLDQLRIERAGLKAFRHANATAMDYLRAPMKTRQVRLGHSDLKVTSGYTHAVSEDGRRVAEQLGRLLFPFVPTLKDSGDTRQPESESVQ